MITHSSLSGKLHQALLKPSKSYVRARLFWGFHVQLIALLSHANMQGVVLVSGLQGEQVYFILFRCCSVTEATDLSSRFMNMVSN